MVFKKGQTAWNKGVKCIYHTSEETKKKQREANKDKTPWNKGKVGCYSQEIIDKMKISNKGRSPFKKIWSNKESAEIFIRHQLQGLMKRPTSFEQKIIDLIKENNLPFKYVGNGQFLINFKNPDFINENDKIAIEVFYSWFKIRDYGSVENYKEFCKNKLEEWKVVFIDENDLNANNWKGICLNKMQARDSLCR
jgi:hypothetical protein